MLQDKIHYPASKPAQTALFEQIIKAGRAGKSHAQIAAQIDISRETLNNWLGKYPEFSRAMALADDYALAWWEALGQRHAETREGNATMIMFVMKNRFEQDYGKDAEEPQSSPPDMAELAELTPKTRQKLRKILLANAASQTV